MQIIGRNAFGGRVIEVRVPLAIFELSREITDRVERGELAEQTEAKDQWLSKVQPFIVRELNGFGYSPTADQIVLQPLESISTLKRHLLYRPSGAAVVSAARHSFGGSYSRPGPSRPIRRKAGR